MARKTKQTSLTDTELVILSAAAHRTDRCALPWPRSLRAAARDQVVNRLVKLGLLAETPAARKSVAWRTDGSLGAMTLALTVAGIAALERADVAQSSQPPSKRTGTKGETILALLRSKRGTTLADMISATGWQAHSIRGFLSGTVSKKLGCKLRSVKPDGGERRYHVEA